MAFSIASYNVLADSYINPAWYGGVDPGALEAAHRHPALAEHIAALTADVLCLQEVEPDVFELIQQRLRGSGHEGKYAGKGGRKPDGCATFVRTDRLALQAVQTLFYADGSSAQPSSGHIALVTVVENEGRPVAVANTHLKWDAPGTPPASQLGLRQIRELLDARARLAPADASWIIGGDLNVTPTSAVVQCLQAAGLRDAYAALPRVFTCNANRKARRIDFLFHSADLTATPLELPPIHDDTPLPSAAQPSDHLAIGAEFDRGQN